MVNKYIFIVRYGAGYLVVAVEAGTERIVGFFGRPDDGQILSCKLTNNATISNVCRIIYIYITPKIVEYFCFAK